MSFLSKATKKVVGVTPVGAYINYNKKKDEKAAREANALAMYSWDLANQYNSPKEQMARLKAAGLNPNLVYGSGNVTGNTTSAPALGAVSSYNGVNDLIGRGVSAMQAYATLKNTNNQNELLKYQMGQTEAQTAYTEAKTRDLNNFLNDNGPSTFDRYRSTATTEPSSVGKDSDELGFVSSVLDVLGVVYGGSPYNIGKRWEKSKLKKSLDKAFEKANTYDLSNFTRDSKRYKSMSSKEKRAFLEYYYL